MTTTSSNQAEQVLQAISDRLGSELDLNKLRIVYGVNDCRNQSVIYGELASGKFRDNISDTQATAILNAIDEPASVSIPVANPKTGNLPNARIQIIYDDQLILRQEKSGSNSINPLYQQAQEQDFQEPVEPVQVPSDQVPSVHQVTATNKQVHSVEADGDHISQEQADRDEGISQTLSSDNVNPWNLSSSVEMPVVETFEVAEAFEQETMLNDDRANLSQSAESGMNPTSSNDFQSNDFDQGDGFDQALEELFAQVAQIDCDYDRSIEESYIREAHLREAQEIVPNESEYDAVNYDRFAETLEQLFSAVDQQTDEATPQSNTTEIENNEFTEPIRPSSDVSSPDIELEFPASLEPEKSHSKTVDSPDAKPDTNLNDWLESGNWTSDPETAARLMSWAEWNKGNDGLINSTSVMSPAALAVSQLPESNTKQFAQALVEDIQNQPEQQRPQQLPSQQLPPQQSLSSLEPEQRSRSPLAATLDRAAHRAVNQTVQWIDTKLEAVERGLAKVGKWLSSRAEAIQNHQAAEIAYKVFDRGFNRTGETQYQHQGFQVEKIENEKNSSIFVLRDTQTEHDLLKFKVEQRTHSAPRVEVLAKSPQGIAPEIINRLSKLESNLGSVRGSNQAEEQRSQNVENFAQVARLANEFGSTRNSHYVVDSGKTELGEDWLRVTAKGNRGVVYEQTGSEIREDLQLRDFRRANVASLTVEIRASQQTTDQER